MRSCLAIIGLGTVILAALVAGWFARDEISGFVSGIVDREKEPSSVEVAAPGSPELARRAEGKIVALGQGELSETELSADELDSWVRHGLAGYFPSYVSDVTVGVEDERLVLAGKVRLKEVPGIERLGPAVALFGDTAAVRLKGRPDGLGPGRGIFYVEGVQIGLLPLPEPMRDELLTQLQGGRESELPVNAIVFEVPRFVTDVGVRGDRVFFRGPTRPSR